MKTPFGCMLAVLTACAAGSSPKDASKTEEGTSPGGLRLIQIQAPAGSKPDAVLWAALVNETDKTYYWYGRGSTPWHEVRRKGDLFEAWDPCWFATAVEGNPIHPGKRAEFAVYRHGSHPTAEEIDAVRLHVYLEVISFERYYSQPPPIPLTCEITGS